MRLRLNEYTAMDMYITLYAMTKQVNDYVGNNLNDYE